MKVLIDGCLKLALPHQAFQPARDVELVEGEHAAILWRVPAEASANRHWEEPDSVRLQKRVDGNHSNVVLSSVSYEPREQGLHTSEAVTRNVRVHVTARYSRAQSEPLRNLWFFLYTIEITNESLDTVQLISRHWTITDAENGVEEVRGLGVIGQQPTLDPGESFEYTSGCPLKTPFGTMHGTYQMVTGTGDRFDVEVAPFTLSEPCTIH